MSFTKGIEYIIAVTFLVGFVVFWLFIERGDENEEESWEEEGKK
jgi:hypothetical protein